ncbi:hypothetical protein KGF56_004629 [Candida oxycetoniae]|uniref:Zn(2)-C6 fungal-type domain-containing protein n=1 Tax=Candida oxycetoniae TaxID=497107 RepID=A0AAI9ST03_9ASCO|nr:uncharacterized protein KGF56_004629 [Candida oxycetoniae]KAI3402537.2 hypothetical protein KGF56_004629 [Candida oxycetoniae]
MQAPDQGQQLQKFTAVNVYNFLHDEEQQQQQQQQHNQHNHHQQDNTKQPIPKLTNKHTTLKHLNPKRKKRVITSRACDACAIRKVKCDPNTPCTHCVTNGLSCTRNRERKKSGPKTLTKKTLDSINNLSEVIDFNAQQHNAGNTFTSMSRPMSRTYTSPSPGLIEDDSNHTSSNGYVSTTSIAQSQSQISATTSINSTNHHLHSGDATDIHSNAAALPGFQQRLPLPSATSVDDYLVTPYHLIENIKLIGDEPAIYELVRPLTVHSIVANHQKLVDFLLANYPNTSTPSGNSHFQEINLIAHHEDSLYISTLLIILTLNQIVAEILIKLKKQKFKDFLRYPKKFLMFRPFKNFKNLCHFKVLEIITLIEKNFIVPPIIPRRRATTLNGDNTNLSTHWNQYQVYYNLSLSNMHLCNYYHILNLTNTLNPTSSMENSYGNEAQEHQKIIYLHRAITFFQLINLREDDSLVPFRELYDLLYSSERYYIVYSSFNYNINIIRNNDIVLRLKSGKFEGLGYLHFLMRIVDDYNMIDVLCRKSNFNAVIDFDKPQTGYYQLKATIFSLQPTESLHELLRDILLFKILLIKPLDFEQSKIEIINIVNSLCNSLERADSDVFKVQLSNYQLLQPLLHVLKIFLEIKQVEVRLHIPINFQDQELLIRYSELLVLHFPFFNNINKLIRAHKILNSLFLILSDAKKDENMLQDISQQSNTPIQAQQSQTDNAPPTTINNDNDDNNDNNTSMVPPLHTGITPTHDQFPSFTNLSRIQSQQRIASQINISELLRVFDDSKLESSEKGVVHPVATLQYKADDEEEDGEEDGEEDEKEQEQEFFSIVPKHEHGHKFANTRMPQNNEHTPSPASQTINYHKNPNLSISESTKSFLSLLNAATFAETSQQFEVSGTGTGIDTSTGTGTGTGAGAGAGTGAGTDTDNTATNDTNLFTSSAIAVSAGRNNMTNPSFLNLFQFNNTPSNS